MPLTINCLHSNCLHLFFKTVTAILERSFKKFHVTNTYSETLNAVYTMFQDATVVHQFDAKLLQYNISQNVTSYSTSIDILNQPTYMAFGLVSERNLDTAYALEPPTTFKTMKLSHIVEGNNVIDLEYNFIKKEDLEKLYRRYPSFATDTSSITPLPLLYKQITNLELKNYNTFWSATSCSSPLILDLSIDKGTTGASSIPWAAANRDFTK